MKVYFNRLQIQVSESNNAFSASWLMKPSCFLIQYLHQSEEVIQNEKNRIGRWLFLGRR